MHETAHCSAQTAAGAPKQKVTAENGQQKVFPTGDFPNRQISRRGSHRGLGIRTMISVHVGSPESVDSCRRRVPSAPVCITDLEARVVELRNHDPDSQECQPQPSGHRINAPTPLHTQELESAGQECAQKQKSTLKPGQNPRFPCDFKLTGFVCYSTAICTHFHCMVAPLLALRASC